MIFPKDQTDRVRRFFSGTGTTYDRIVNLCTLEFDRLWKYKILRAIPEGSARILDQACGTGILTLKLARRFPQARIVGVDLTEEYLRVARKKAEALGLKRVTFIRGRAEDVRPELIFDCITSSYLAKYADLERLIATGNDLLRVGGTLILHDFTYPANPVLARIWEFYFRLLQTLGAWKYPQWKTVFDELPGFLRETQWTRELPRMLPAYGFSEITQTSLTWGTSALVTARKVEDALERVNIPVNPPGFSGLVRPRGFQKGSFRQGSAPLPITREVSKCGQEDIRQINNPPPMRITPRLMLLRIVS
jgi:demethylmenaquinone methyltransferase/2-methoxy-6-polyprenyl-1,4-benzoquinol methylase